MDRAYSILDVKELKDDGEFVTIEGIASTPTPDRMGDVVDPMGAQFKTPMPLLWQHQSGAPVGNVTFAKPTKQGIPFVAQLPIIKEAGNLKDRVDEAIQSLKYKLVAAVSIGFRALKDGVERIEGGGYKFKQWEWMELSLVTIPAQSEAVITAIKSIDQQHLAPQGDTGAEVDNVPGDSGKQKEAVKRGFVSLRPREKQREPHILKIIPRNK